MIPQRSRLRSLLRWQHSRTRRPLASTPAKTSLAARARPARRFTASCADDRRKSKKIGRSRATSFPPPFGGGKEVTNAKAVEKIGSGSSEGTLYRNTRTNLRRSARLSRPCWSSRTPCTTGWSRTRTHTGVRTHSHARARRDTSTEIHTHKRAKIRQLQKNKMNSREPKRDETHAGGSSSG